MVIGGGSSTANGEERPLLNNIVEGAVDYQGRPVLRSKSGGWRSAAFIISVEVAERFAYFGIGSNLINYLSGTLGQSTASAAENVNAWIGASSLLPLFGAFVADSYLGRFRTILIASLLYILGLGLMVVSATLPSVSCSRSNKTMRAPEFQVILFFFSLYLVAVAQGGHRPCVQALGADQFDEQDPEESKAKCSFFNWWNFGICAGAVVTNLIVSYIEENLSWVLGFGIPCTVMLIALIVFLLGSKSYTYTSNTGDKKSPIVRIGRVFGAAFRHWHTDIPIQLANEDLSQQCSQQFKFLNRALLAQYEKPISIAEVEEAKGVLRLVPIWGSCLVYSILTAQVATLFVKQGTTMDRTVLGLNIPAAYLLTFICVVYLILIPIYDRLFLPFARSFTGKPSGITMLQRIGTGLFISILSMVVAALVEMKRLKIAQQYGLVDMPNATIPMSLGWLVPQFLLVGTSDVFAFVGLQEFFYDQVPNELRSIGLALYLSIFGVGNFLSSILVSIIDQLTRPDTWFSSNLNRAHLDYFYWLLAGFSAIGFSVYLYFTRSYIYKGGCLH